MAFSYRSGNRRYLKAIHRTDNGIQTLATYEQDARGRLTEADARLDYHLFYEYDAADRIIRWSDNDQTWSRFTYDAQGRCVTVTGAEGYIAAHRVSCGNTATTPAADEQRNAATGRKSASRICGTATVLRKSGNTAMINCTAYGTWCLTALS
ncbi:RHS repeat protein [Escherichia coli]|nr:RHS repeat protein [Escherichia coli]